jgi:PKD repeat protein
MNFPLTPYRKLAILAIASICSFSAKAQVPTTAAGYLFTAYNQPFVPITGGTIASNTHGDDITHTNIPIGFTFPFATGTYTTLSACSNGWLSLSNNGAATIGNTAATAGTLGPLLMPLWDDCNGSPSGQARFVTTGTAPNRVFTFQYGSWRWYYNSNGNNVLSIQVRLYESGRIEFHYAEGPDPVSGSTTPTATIGIARNATDYQTLSNSTANPTSSSAAFTTNIATRPVDGQVYSWDSPLPNNASVATIPQPNEFICVGQHTVAATVKNLGGNVINNVRVNWSIDGNVQPFVTYSQPIPIGGTSAVIPLGNAMMPVSTFTHKITVWTSHPNGLTDPKPDNDTLQISRKAMDPPSAFMFFEKTRICPGDSLLLWAPYDPVYTYVWQFEGNPMPGATDSAVWVKNEGNYSVKVFNPACSAQSSFHKITVKPAEVDLGGDSSMCETIPSQILDADEPNASYIWSTGDTTQTIPVWESGKYWVEVKLSQYCMASDTVNLEIKPLPKINGISYVTDGLTYEFEPGGPQYVDTYLWEFGDGSSSTDKSPTHTYASHGLYDVTLRVYNACGETITKMTTPVNVGDVIAANDIAIYPNPASAGLTIDSRGAARISEYRVYNMMGSLLGKFTADTPGKKLVVDVSGYPAGTYTIVINTTEGNLNKTFQVMK